MHQYEKYGNPPPPSYFNHQIHVAPSFQPPPTPYPNAPMMHPPPQPPPPQNPTSNVHVQVQTQAPAAPIIIQQQHPHYLGSKNVCCMTARSWTIFIAWTQMIFCGIVFIAMITALAKLGTVKQTISESWGHVEVKSSVYTIRSYDTPYYNDLLSYADKLCTVVLIICIVMLIVSAFGFITGVILQQGVSQKKPTYLTVWIVYSVFNILVAIGMSITISSIMEQYNNGSTYFIGNFAVSIFYIWVVAKHRSELERQNNQVLPLNHVQVQQPQPIQQQPQMMTYSNSY